ncbi:MAG TPA: hypothetical protein VF168_00845 [Trueperaceae bacterium]
MKTVIWIIGALLIVVGVISLIFGDFTLLQHEAAIELAPLKLRAAEGSTIPLPPLIGGALVILGVVLMTVGLADAGLPMKRRLD